ncbi:MAG: YggT family protein [Candidatus Villigracilaceae bacterium]
MIDFVIAFLNILAQVLILLVITDVILSYILSPYHPVRNFVDRIVDPLLAPIRRVVPLIGIFDLSPIVFILLVQVVASVLLNLLDVLR